jgi:hypothetical protein
VTESIGEFLLLERVRGRLANTAWGPVMADLKPLALTDQQFGLLMDAAEQLNPLDRDPFLNAIGRG